MEMPTELRARLTTPRNEYVPWAVRPRGLGWSPEKADQSKWFWRVDGAPGWITVECPASGEQSTYFATVKYVYAVVADGRRAVCCIRQE